jgi:hypothetical protein
MSPSSYGGKSFKHIYSPTMGLRLYSDSEINIVELASVLEQPNKETRRLLCSFATELKRMTYDLSAEMLAVRIG